MIKNIHRFPCDDEGELVSEATHKKYLSVQTEGKIVIKMIQRPPYTSSQGILDYYKNRNKKSFALENDFDKAIKPIEKKKKEKS